MSSIDDSPRYPLRSVGNALRLLVLIQQHGNLTLTDAAHHLGVAPSTAHRLLAMLAYHGFVEERSNSRGYVLGPTLVNIAETAAGSLDLRSIARPHLEALSLEVQETVNLMLLEGRDIVFVDCVEPPKPLRIGSRVGLRRPATATSAGKAILAALSSAELDLLFPPDQPLPALTELTLSDRASLDAELAVIRSRGYATNFGESDPEIRGVGVAIPGVVRHLRAGLAIAAPATRLVDEHVPEVGAAAIRAARRISEALQR